MARKKTTTRKKKTTRKRNARRTPAMRRSTTGRSKKKTTRSAPRKARAAGGRASTSGVSSSLSIEDLHRELQARIGELHARRDALLAELADVDRMIADFSGNSGAGAGAPVKRASRSSTSTSSTPVKRTARAAGGQDRRARGAGGKNLVDSLHEVLKGKKMRVSELAEAVQAAGYATKAANFRVIVNAALLKNTDRFKKVSRGVYTAK